jgi:hypothetical protein
MGRHGWANRRTDREIDGRTYRLMERQMNGQTDVQTYRWTNMDRRIARKTNEQEMD